MTSTTPSEQEIAKACTCEEPADDTAAIPCHIHGPELTLQRLLHHHHGASTSIPILLKSLIGATPIDGKELTPEELARWSLLGKGGYGTAFKSPEEDVVVKVSIRDHTNREWVIEYNMAKPIFDFIASASNEFRLVQVAEPFGFESDTEHCLFAMRFVRPIINTCMKEIPTHIYLSDDAKDFDRVFAGRGRFLGYGVLEQMGVLTHDEIREITAEIGMFVGILHFQFLLDGDDLEFLVSIDKKVYIIDFDLVRPIKDFKESMDSIISSLDALDYIPKPGDSLYSEFERGYLKIADAQGRRKEADAILRNYRERNDI